MKRQILCILGAVTVSAGIIAACDYASRESTLKNQSAQLEHLADEDISVGDYAKDNYNSDFWKTYNYEPVEYMEVTAGVADFSEELEAKAAILIDLDTKTVIYSKNADEELAPASTTKLATAITAIEILKPSDVITIGNEINLIASDSSKAGLRVGEKLTFKELMEGMMLSSGNDAAYVIARAAGEKLLNDNIAYEGEDITIQQCIKRFIYEMNKNVRDIGLTNTQFTNPDGYDEEGQYTTASDLSKIAYIAYDNELIREICQMVKATTKNKKYTFSTTNELLLEDSEYYYKYAKGMKTGSTDNAGKCLVSVAQKDDNACISVILNSTTEGRYEDSLKLLQYFIGE